jgi:glycosyltransferase
MNNPKISIITICFNNEKDIRATIESVINQTYYNIEYIVVDGASTDNSLKIIKEYENRISKFISEPDNGMYDAINKGIKMASGTIIGLIHAGDSLYNTLVIEKIASHFIQNDIDISYGHSKIVNQKDKPVRINKSPEFNRSLIRLGWMPSHQSIYLRKKLFEKLGYYRTDLGGIGDYEWFIRYFYLNDLQIKRLDEFIVKFSLGGRSTKNYSNKLKKSSKEITKDCWRLNDLNPPWGIVYKKWIRKPQQFILAWFDKG